MKNNLFLSLLLSLSSLSLLAQKTFNGAFHCSETNTSLHFHPQGYGAYVTHSNDEYFVFKYWEAENEGVFNLRYHTGEEAQLMLMEIPNVGLNVMDGEYNSYSYEKVGPHEISSSDLAEIKGYFANSNTGSTMASNNVSQQNNHEGASSSYNNVNNRNSNNNRSNVRTNNYNQNNTAASRNSCGHNQGHSIPMIKQHKNVIPPGIYVNQDGSGSYTDISADGAFIAHNKHDGNIYKGIVYYFSDGTTRAMSNTGIWIGSNYTFDGTTITENLINQKDGSKMPQNRSKRTGNSQMSKAESDQIICETLNYFFQGEGASKKYFAIDGQYRSNKGTPLDLHPNGSFTTKADGQVVGGSYILDREGAFQSMTTTGVLTDGKMVPKGLDIEVTVNGKKELYVYQGPSRINAYDAYRLLRDGNKQVAIYNRAANSHRVNMAVIGNMTSNIEYYDQYGLRVW